jgi:hypothetical protein
MKELSEWQNFYVIVGSSAGALIGLQFVLISLISRLPVGEGGSQASSAFSTPTVVHFTVVLLLSGAGTAPWHRTAPLAVLWCTLGLAGIGYAITIVWKLSSQTVYTPEAEDWLFHAVLPFVAYGVLAASSIYERADLHRALFAIAGATLLLLIIGIHNAWDAATYHVFTFQAGKNEQKQSSVPK